MTSQDMHMRLAAIEADALGTEYDAAQRIADAATMMAATIKPADPPSAPHPLESGEISEEWINQVIEVEAAKVRLDKRRGVLLTLAKAATDKVQGLHYAADGKILAGYKRELKRLLTAIEDISDELGDVDTAAKAIEADAGPLWKQLAALADDYDVLRSYQMSRVDAEIRFKTSPEFPGEDHASDLFISNLDDVWPHWRRGGVDPNRMSLDSNAVRPEPWPADKTELMLWLVRSAAKPWIPTTGQLQRLGQERHARNNPMPKVEPARFDPRTRQITQTALK